MPELPEVQTTVNGLNEVATNKKIVGVWTDYGGKYWKGSDTIKDTKYWSFFKRKVVGSKIIKASRRAKNILIHLDNGHIILIHMKMTGHFIHGKYVFDKTFKKDPWQPVHPPSLLDPYNRNVHFVISLSNGKHIALSDTRKFAKVTLVNAEQIHSSKHTAHIGPEPLEREFDFKAFISRINMKPKGKIKLVLMDQTIVAGIGNIYADESLWLASIHPLSIVSKIPENKLKDLFKAIKHNLSRGIEFGGDSMSDYRNIHGKKGSFQEEHHVYQRKGEKCDKKGCKGIIDRIVVGTRGTHICPIHQELFM